MLERDELAETAATFGVAEEQVLRDHLISHVLSSLPNSNYRWCSLAEPRSHVPI